MAREILFSEKVSNVLENANIYDWAIKVNNKLELSSDEREITNIMDSFAREIGTKGRCSDNTFMIAELIKKVVEPMVYNPDQSIIDDMFNVGSIGEFDEKRYETMPKNTLKVYDSVRGGNVPKSFIDSGVLTPATFDLQVETELDYSDLRRNGFKSIAKMTQFAEEALNNEKFFRIFSGVDAALNALTGDQDIDSGSALTLSNLVKSVNYINTVADGNPYLIGLSDITNQIPDMSGYSTFLSEDMKNELNRIGKIETFRGVKIQGIPAARKTGIGNTLIPQKRLFAIGGKIGDLDMVGELRNYETYDNDSEKVKLKWNGLKVSYAIYYLDKIARITLA